MPVTPASVRLETTRRTRRHARVIGEAIERVRVGSGLSKAYVARAAGIHPSHLARVESGQVVASVPVLIALSVALGCDLGIRLFTGAGPSIHDRHQAPMVEAMLRMIPPGRWRPDVEVPVTDPRRGVIDLTLDERATVLTVAAEFQSTIPRVEEMVRWHGEKATGLAAMRSVDDGPRRVDRLLVLRSTLETRDTLIRSERTFATAYPARANDVAAALTTVDAPWPGSGIVWMHVEAGEARLLPGPTRGVRVGR